MEQVRERKLCEFAGCAEATGYAHALFGLTHNSPIVQGQIADIILQNTEKSDMERQISDFALGDETDAESCMHWFFRPALLVYNGDKTRVIEAIKVYLEFTSMYPIPSRMFDLCALLDVNPFTGDVYDKNVRLVPLEYSPLEVRDLRLAGRTVYDRPLAPPTEEEKSAYVEANKELVDIYLRSAWKDTPKTHVRNMHWLYRMCTYYPGDYEACLEVPADMVRAKMHTYLHSLNGVLKIKPNVDEVPFIARETPRWFHRGLMVEDAVCNQLRDRVKTQIVAGFSMCMARLENLAYVKMRELQTRNIMLPNITQHEVDRLVQATARLRQNLAEKFYMAVLTDVQYVNAQQTLDDSIKALRVKATGISVPSLRSSQSARARVWAQSVESSEDLCRRSMPYLTMLKLKALKFRMQFWKMFIEWQTCMYQTVEVEATHEALYADSIETSRKVVAQRIDFSNNNIMAHGATIGQTRAMYGCRFGDFTMPLVAIPAPAGDFSARNNVTATLEQLDSADGLNAVMGSILAPGPIAMCMASLINTTVGSEAHGNSFRILTEVYKVQSSKSLLDARTELTEQLIQAAWLDVLKDKYVSYVLTLNRHDREFLFKHYSRFLAGKKILDSCKPRAGQPLDEGDMDIDDDEDEFDSPGNVTNYSEGAAAATSAYSDAAPASVARGHFNPVTATAAAAMGVSDLRQFRLVPEPMESDDD